MNPEAVINTRPQPVARISLRAWLAQSAIGRALASRRAERDLNAAVMRLSDLSPHLLHDIGVIDGPEQVDEPAPRKTRPDLAAAPRPAFRSAIEAPVRMPEMALPVRAAQDLQAAAN
jgi:hypothetical protein